ncbi:MAG: Gfo/Idh/MocA family oxidoreductase, partial [Actinobacteria bacterium]|nr:Gfo/Idh/MocA family oxidoreductase [Actinomycetota bacterium]
MVEPDRPSRVLLVGLGRQGRRHLRVAGLSASGHVVATVDPVADGVDGVPRHSCIQDALEEVGPVDAAVVATPAADHLSSASALLERGIPTLVEKPMAFDLHA